MAMTKKRVRSITGRGKASKDVPITGLREQLGSSLLQKGDKISLEDDGTFEIAWNDIKLGFKLRRDENYVECVSVRGPDGRAPGPDLKEHPDDLLSRDIDSLLDPNAHLLSPDIASLLSPDLRGFLSPDLHGFLHPNLSGMLRRDASVVFSTVLDDDTKLKAGVSGFRKLSKSIQDRGESKPLVVIRVAGTDDMDMKTRADRVKSAVRGLRMDAHVLTMPGEKGR
jgi:hypothetical protein